MASIGTGKIAPGTPHIQNQNTRAKMMSAGFSVKRLTSSVGVGTPSVLVSNFAQ
jgi:hypothetical protein